MKKISKLLTFTALGVFVTSCLSFVTTKKSSISLLAQDETINYKDYFAYDQNDFTVSENYSLASRGMDEDKSGLLFSSTNTGLDAEGIKFSYKSILNGNFSTDLRVFSQKNYTPLDESYLNTPYVNGVWNERILQQTSDDYNPYLDLKEVAITITSKIDSSKWFTIFLQGASQIARCDTVSASVLLSTDNTGIVWNERGYGLYYDSYTVNMWNTGSFTQLGGSSFSNRVLYQDKTYSTGLSFDLETMTVYAEVSGVRSNIRHIESNEGLVAEGFGEAFGTLSKADFAYGYNVSFEYRDVTPDNYVVNYADSQFASCEEGYADLTEAYLRRANMIIYSINGNEFKDRSGNVEKITSAIVADGTTLDADKFTGGNSAYVLSSKKTGDDAEGTRFGINKVFNANDPLEIDFRVFSEKSYKAKNPSATTTHDYCWNIQKHLVQAADLYVNDRYNPYMDLKEVSFKLTSAVNPNDWIKIIVRGGAGMGRADLSTARVVTSADQGVSMGIPKPDGIGNPYSQMIVGYGLQNDGGWPGVGWDPESNGGLFTQLGGSFSNTVVSGSSVSNKLTFFPDSFFVYGDFGYSRLIRDCNGNTNMNDGGAYGYKSLSPSVFASGYTLEIEFTDVTDNLTTANSLKDQYSCRADLCYTNIDNQYEEFTTPYERHANMVLYGLKTNGTKVDLDNAFVSKRDVITKSEFSTTITQGQPIEVTPVIEDVLDGQLEYNGTVTWTNTSTSESDIIPSQGGKYYFTPNDPVRYRLDFSASSYGKYNPSAAFSTYIDVVESIPIHYVDANGNPIKDVSFPEGSKIAFEDYIPEDGTIFIGWEYDDGVYPAGYEMYLKDEITLKAVTIDFELDGGRYIRYVNSINYKYGMMQNVAIDQEKYQSFVNDGYVRKAYGYVLPTDMIKGEFVPSSEGVNIPIEFKEGASKFGISNIKTQNFNRDFSFMAYFTFKFTDGTSKIVHTSYNPDEHVSNVYEVALSEYNESLSEAQKKVLNYYINGVISLTQTETSVSSPDERIKVNSAKLVDSSYYEINISVDETLYATLKEYAPGTKLSLFVNGARKVGTLLSIADKNLSFKYSA